MRLTPCDLAKEMNRQIGDRESQLSRFDRLALADLPVASRGSVSALAIIDTHERARG